MELYRTQFDQSQCLLDPGYFIMRIIELLFDLVNARMRNERVIVRKLSNMAYSHGSLQVLYSFSYKNSRLLKSLLRVTELLFELFLALACKSKGPVCILQV